MCSKSVSSSSPLVWLVCIVLTLVAGATSRADLAADYQALISGTAGQVIASPGTPGSVAMFGTAAFPVLLGTASPVQAVMGAGRYGDSYASTAARAVATAHTGFFDTAGGARSTLFTNSVLWAGKQATPAATTVAVVSNTTVKDYLTAQGYTTTAVTSFPAQWDPKLGIHVT